MNEVLSGIEQQEKMSLSRKLSGQQEEDEQPEEELRRENSTTEGIERRMRNRNLLGSPEDDQRSYQYQRNLVLRKNHETTRMALDAQQESHRATPAELRQNQQLAEERDIIRGICRDKEDTVSQIRNEMSQLRNLKDEVKKKVEEVKRSVRSLQNTKEELQQEITNLRGKKRKRSSRSGRN